MTPPCTERYARWCERTAVRHRLLLDLSLSDLISYDILRTWETREPGGLPSFSEGLTLQTKERRALPMVTYSDLIQFCIFIVALVGLCYKIFKDKRK